MNNKKSLLGLMLVLIFLTGCASEANDLSQWMASEQKKMRGKIAPLPEAKEYTPVAYSVTSNPFEIKEEVTLKDIENMKYAPDPNRRKEPLEFVPLETLLMTGFLIKGNKPVGIIKAPDGIFHYVELGNYMGVNHGQIKSITEGSITLEERVQSGETWVLQKNIIELADGTQKRK